MHKSDQDLVFSNKRIGCRHYTKRNLSLFLEHVLELACNWKGYLILEYILFKKIQIETRNIKNQIFFKSNSLIQVYSCLHVVYFILIGTPQWGHVIM